MKSRRKWGSADAARRQRRREIFARLRHRKLRHPRKHARRCPAFFRLVSGRGPKVSPACVCMQDARVPPLRVEKWRPGYLHCESEMTGPLGTDSFAVSCLLFPRNITNELNGLRSATRSYLNGNPSSHYVPCQFSRFQSSTISRGDVNFVRMRCDSYSFEKQY